jgi:hypothetical protein
MERQTGPSVVAKLAEIDATWEQHKTALAARPQELQRAMRAYRMERMRFEESPRLYVLALSVVMIAGETLALVETYEQRRAWAREQRQLRDERRSRTAAERQQRMAARQPEATEHTQDLPATGLVEIGDQAAADTKNIRPRRRVEGGMVTDGAAVVDGVVSVEE